MANNTVDLSGLGALDIPSVYYGAISNLLGKIDPEQGKLMAKTNNTKGGNN